MESDTLFAGYHNRPDATAEAFTGPWFRTGDAGRVDEAGYVYITDRIKDMIITGGMNVYPAELEKVLAGMPGIAEAAVFGTPHERWGEAVTVAVTPSPGAAVTGEDVIGFLSGRVAGYKKPSRGVRRRGASAQRGQEGAQGSATAALPGHGRLRPALTGSALPCFVPTSPALLCSDQLRSALL
ncbi:AMP-binding enzyme [Streptosporangium vulgare]|uniref:AMP-binding enzyme n=1 Tax=Streptosporangium vulgare TaxID=46190 RepID=UPI0031D4674B